MDKSVVSIVKGTDLGKMVEEVVSLLGGINTLIKPNSTVVVRPNAGHDYPPETSVNTRPALVAAVIRELRKAEPKEIILAEASAIGCDTMECLEVSGIGKAAEDAGVDRIVDIKMEDFAIEVPAPKETAVGADEFRLLAQSPFAMCHMHTLFKQLREGTSPIRVMHLKGTNPLVAYPDTKQVKEGLLSVDFLSVADLYMSPTAEYADVVLPVAHWLETDDILDMHPRFMIGAINKSGGSPR